MKTPESSDEIEATKTASAGLPVVYCLPGSAAHYSGVRGGDVIVEVNGVKITDTLSYLRACRLNEEGMRVTVLRGKELIELAIPLQVSGPKVNVSNRFAC